jgi:hypothetical protein
MAHDTCPTVNVVADNEQGFMIINESDFNPELHKIFGVDDTAAAAAKTTAAQKKAQEKADKAAAEAQALADAEKLRTAQLAGGVDPLAPAKAPWMTPPA